MKKVLSFVLVLAMILGSVSMAFAAPKSTFASGEVVSATNTVVPFADAKDNFVTTILRDLGVVDGDSDGNINAKDGLTRAEATALIVKAWGLGAQGAVQTTTKFTDVKKTDWFSGYVAVAAANGFVDGNGGKFNPNGKLTMDEAITLVLKALGYDAAHLDGVWPENYQSLALALSGFLAWEQTVSPTSLELKVKTSVKMGTQAATRGDLFNLIFNCIAASEDASEGINAGRPVVWKATSATNGVVAGSFQVPTNGLNLVTKITMNNSYKTFASLGYSFEYFASYTKTDKKFVNKLDATEYYGHPVILVEKDQKAFGVAKDSATNTITGNFSKDAAVATITTTFTAIDGTVYTGLKAATDMGTFINGKKVAYDGVNKLMTYTLELTCDKTNPTKNASITAIKYDEICEVVIVNATDAAVLASENLYRYFNPSALNEFAGAHDAWKKLATTDAGIAKNTVLDPETTLVVEGAATKLSEIQKNDVVEIYWYGGFADNTAHVIAKMVVTRNVVTGPITSYSGKAGTYTVNGTAYKTGLAQATTASGKAFTFGLELDKAVEYASEYALYLNAAGRIQYAKLTAVQEKLTTRYAFVLTAETTDNWTNNGKAWKAASNMAITLLPLDTMVAEEYELISSGALDDASNVVVTTTDYTWDNAVATTTDLRIVEFKNSGDTLKALYLITVATGTDRKVFNEKATLATFGAAKLDGVSYFKNAKIYTVSTSTDLGVTYASESAYKLTTVADMAKKTTNNFVYKLDANGYIDTVIVKDWTYVAKTTKVTVAAITSVDTDATGKYITYIQPGVATEAKLYVATNAGTAKDVEWSKYENKASLAAFGLKDSKVVTIDAITLTLLNVSTGDKDYTDAKKFGYNGEALVYDLAFAQMLNPTTYFMYVDKTTGVNCLVNVEGIDAINAKFEKATDVYYYAGALYDVVIIDLPAAE